MARKPGFIYLIHPGFLEISGNWPTLQCHPVGFAGDPTPRPVVAGLRRRWSVVVENATMLIILKCPDAGSDRPVAGKKTHGIAIRPRAGQLERILQTKPSITAVLPRIQAD